MYTFVACNIRHVYVRINVLLGAILPRGKSNKGAFRLHVKIESDKISDKIKYKTAVCAPNKIE